MQLYILPSGHFLTYSKIFCRNEWLRPNKASLPETWRPVGRSRLSSNPGLCVLSSDPAFSISVEETKGMMHFLSCNFLFQFEDIWNCSLHNWVYNKIGRWRSERCSISFISSGWMRKRFRNIYSFWWWRIIGIAKSY